MSIRRAHTLRNQPRYGYNASDDLGTLRDTANETAEDMLRRELLAKERENDRLRDQVQTLEALLKQRPPLEHVQTLQKEYQSLDLILQGTMRENERAMAELERAKDREKTLERELARLAGENWQATLNLTGVANPTTLSSSLGNDQPSESANSGSEVNLEKVRLLVLGIDQRLGSREEKLQEMLKKAEEAGRKYERLKEEIQG